jgi:hypothetical protein
MPVDPAALATLVDEVGRFYVTDRAMRRAQDEMIRALAANAEPEGAQVAAYLAAVERYFSGFEREARSHLADIERRLAKVSQLQFNLSAERGVTARRVEATQGVLAHVLELGGR